MRRWEAIACSDLTIVLVFRGVEQKGVAIESLEESIGTTPVGTGKPKIYKTSVLNVEMAADHLPLNKRTSNIHCTLDAGTLITLAPVISLTRMLLRGPNNYDRHVWQCSMNLRNK